MFDGSLFQKFCFKELQFSLKEMKHILYVSLNDTLQRFLLLMKANNENYARQIYTNNFQKFIY